MKTILNTIKYKVAGLCLAVSGMLLSSGAQAQDQPHYSMYMLQQPVVNVGAMGSYDRIYGGLIGNYQLVGFNGAPLTGLLDFGFPVKNTGLVLGFNIQQEKIGVNYRTNASFNASYRIKLNIKHYLALGMGVGAKYVNSNFSSLGSNEPLFTQDYSYITPTIRFGVYYFTNNLYVGAAVNNILSNRLENTGGSNSSRITANPEDMHYILQAGYQYKFLDVWKFQPSVLFKYIYGAPLQFDLNAHFLFRDMIGFGASYRSLGTLVVLADYTFNDLFTIGYSVNFGLQTARQNGFFHGHEVYLGFKLRRKGSNTIPVDVPRF